MIENEKHVVIHILRALKNILDTFNMVFSILPSREYLMIWMSYILLSCVILFTESMMTYNWLSLLLAAVGSFRFLLTLNTNQDLDPDTLNSVKTRFEAKKKVVEIVLSSLFSVMVVIMKTHTQIWFQQDRISLHLVTLISGVVIVMIYGFKLCQKTGDVKEFSMRNTYLYEFMIFLLISFLIYGVNELDSPYTPYAIVILAGFRIYFRMNITRTFQNTIRFSELSNVPNLGDKFNVMVYIIIDQVVTSLDFVIGSLIQYWFHQGKISFFWVNVVSEIVFLVIGLCKFKWSRICSNTDGETTEFTYGPSKTFTVQTVMIIVLSSSILFWDGNTTYSILITIFVAITNTLNEFMMRKFSKDLNDDMYYSVDTCSRASKTILYLIEVEVYIIAYFTSRGYAQNYYTDKKIHVGLVATFEEVSLLVLSLVQIPWRSLEDDVDEVDDEDEELLIV